MKLFIYTISTLFIFGFYFTIFGRNDKQNEKSKIYSLTKLRKHFKNPPVDYRSAPLWVWNDEMSKDIIDQQLVDFQSVGIGGVFIHPRPGLITPYLSNKWNELFGYTVDRAKELGMHVWIYDENSYPSGFAGGHVPAEMPESYNQGQGLKLTKKKILSDEVFQKYFLVLKNVNSKFIEITNELDRHLNLEGDYFLFEKSFYRRGGWFGGFSYVDLLLDGVTEKFIELTMTGYEKEFGDEFGKVVPGIFTDEPNIEPPGDIKWTPGLFTEFKNRWEYDLKTNLPSLFYEIGNWKKIRHDYYSLLLKLFIDRWSKLWYKYCEEHDLKWTGHYWEHGWPNPIHGSDNMAMYAWHQIPAIDILMNQYSENVNAQFGNVRSVRELNSVANQMGNTRTLSETYGAGGWDLRFEDMKRIGDWEYVLGVNILNQHLSYATIKGARKRDHPQSFSYHEPWWKQYKKLGDYFARLSLALSSGKQINRILILEPTTTGWMYFSPYESHQNLSKLGEQFQEFLVSLEKSQVEYDLGSENIINNNGKIIENKFSIGERSYDLLVLPPGIENLDKNTAELIEQFLIDGGKVLSFVEEPQFIDGVESKFMNILSKEYSSQWIKTKSISQSDIHALIKSNKIEFDQPEKIRGKLFHNRRELEEGQLLFLVNTSLDEWSTGKFEMEGKSVLELNALNGKLLPYPGNYKDDKVEVLFDIPPAGSLLLFLSSNEETEFIEGKSGSIKILSSLNDLEVEKLTPNVLTLDYCDLEINNNIEKDIYFFQAQNEIYKYYGYKKNPWNSAVQYKTLILDQKPILQDSNIKVNYFFTASKGIDKSSLQMVVERPELWKISINDKPILPNQNESWLDKVNGVFDIGQHVIEGKNKITLTIEEMTVHSELESIYILGNFGLESADKGWNLVPSPEIELGSWRKQKMPFYSDGVKYSKVYKINKNDKRYIIKLTDWYGSTSEVLVNQKSAGIIAWTPNELDITDFINEGNNEISVIVYGTLKNLLGPHHIGQVRGTAWPASFESAPKNLLSGSDYDFIDYGLYEDFSLIEYDGAPKKVYWRISSVSNPTINLDSQLSIDSNIEIELSTETDKANIYYTLDGSEPDNTSNLYSEPIIITQSSVLKTRAFKENLVASKVIEKSVSIVDSKKNGLEYQYFEGNWEELPDFSKLSPKHQGRVYDIDMNLIDTRNGNFALTYSGYIKIEKEGEYSFFTDSNDGSKLFINDKCVVDNGGSHSSQLRQGKVKLNSGMHKILLYYFDSGGSRDLKVLYKGPNITKQVIPADMYFWKNKF